MLSYIKHHMFVTMWRQHISSHGAQFVKYVSAERVCVSGLKRNLINFFSVCLFLDVSATITSYFVPATLLYSAEKLRN